MSALYDKYNPVTDLIYNSGGIDVNVTEENGVLKILATVPSPSEKVSVWNKIKEIGGDNPSDINADIRMINSEIATGGVVAEGSGAGARSYTVKSGDTLSKISKEFYGDANKYMDIFNANSDKLKDPDKIQVGMELNIP